jgi:hypothetical protein
MSTNHAESLKAHPSADVFPVMDETRLSELKADIQANGQREPITLCDGMILDGRNRYRACVELGIEPTTRTFAGDPWAFAWSLNGARRDLDATVRALIFKRCEKGSAKWTARLAQIAEDGNRKKAEAAKGNTNAVKTKAKTDACHDDVRLKKSGKNVALPARAADAKVSPATMARADQIAKRPDLEQKVVAGEMKPAEALRVIRGKASQVRRDSRHKRQPPGRSLTLIADCARAFLRFHPKRAEDLEALLSELVTHARGVADTHKHIAAKR